MEISDTTQLSEFCYPPLDFHVAVGFSMCGPS